MVITEVIKEETLDIVKDWAHARGLSFNRALLPPVGFISYIDDEPIAVLFVSEYKHIPVVAFDNLFSNPNAGYRIVRAIKSLFRTARDYVYAMADLSDENRPLIQCRIDSKIVDTLQRKHPDWVVSKSDYKLCYLTPEKH